MKIYFRRDKNLNDRKKIFSFVSFTVLDPKHSILCVEDLIKFMD